MKIAYEKEGVEYCTFEVAKMKEADAFGREYTVYYSKRWQTKSLPPKKKGSRKKKTQKEEEKLPF